MGTGEHASPANIKEKNTMRYHRRPDRQRWLLLRMTVWKRDGGQCRGPYCRAAAALALIEAHIDHIVPLRRGGDNSIENLRTLCRRCHVLRADAAHRGMIAAALRDEIIPPNWRSLIWEDS